MVSVAIRSIRAKLFVSIFIVTFLYALVLVFQIGTQYNDSIKDALLGQKKAVAISVRSLIKDQLHFFSIDDLSGIEATLKKVYLENEEVNYIYISSNTGVILYKYDPDAHIVYKNVELFHKLKSDVRFEIDYEFLKTKDSYEAIVPIIQKGQFVGRIHVATSIESIDSIINELITRVLFSLAIIVLLTIPVFYFLISKIIIKPLNILSRKVRTLARDKDFSSQIDFRSSIEFERIAKDFNYMNESLKNYYADIQSLNRNLENIVKSRTEELVHSSEDLKLKNKTLEQTLKANEKMQQILIQQEKLASLGEVVAGIAHEINNPLNFVINGAQMAERSFSRVEDKLPKDSAEAQDIAKQVNNIHIALDMVKKNGLRATSIVKNMLNHARGTDGHREVINIKNTIDEYLKLAIHGFHKKGEIASFSIDKNFDSNIPLISVVKEDIERVLLNIFNNSLYALDKRREREDSTYIPKLTIKLAYEDNKVLIVIHDNGTGISKEVKDRIFDPFFTTKPTSEGTGLGMSMCHDIITSGHGGEIKVESEEGSYTEFKISLPVE